MGATARTSSGSTTLAGVLLGALAIVALSAGLGIAVNHWSPRGIPLLPRQGQERIPLPPGLRAITLKEMRRAFDDGSALFVDARPPEEYSEAHIPEAVNIPPDDFEDRLLDVVEQVEAAPSVIVYCSAGECSDAIAVAERLLEVRQAPINVYEPGWQAWEEAGHPIAREQAP